MKYLLISDIHGSLPALERALTFYKEQSCDMLCILGDILNYGPRNGLPDGLNPQMIAERLNAMAADIVAIRGNCDSEVDQMLLRFPIMADYLLLVDNGKRLLLTHGHIYNKEQMPTMHCDAFFCGHTHLWELSRLNHTVICNLGSITFPKGGNPPTFATYENGVIRVYKTDGELLSEMKI
ncbi:MAG: phosphodiesterase [Prevotella sp.]|nr:MAG: phosphodiesterase [Prevotella sp.]